MTKDVKFNEDEFPFSKLFPTSSDHIITRTHTNHTNVPFFLPKSNSALLVKGPAEQPHSSVINLMIHKTLTNLHPLLQTYLLNPHLFKLYLQVTIMIYHMFLIPFDHFRKKIPMNLILTLSYMNQFRPSKSLTLNPQTVHQIQPITLGHQI